MNRLQIADAIVARMKPLLQELAAQWQVSGAIAHCVVDDLLPLAMATGIRRAFPSGTTMRRRHTLRELKYVAAQMDQYDPLLEEALYAFQDPRVVQLVAQITGLQALEPDDQLYAGGISMMDRGHFLNPHLDNSHDRNRERYRVLNLLYYVSPGWSYENGGNLELWPKGIQGEQTTIVSRFNRLAVMVTHTDSWHSVSRVTTGQSRCCVSNYYFSAMPAQAQDYFHVTSFRGRPEQPIRDCLLRADGALRMGLRRLFPKGVVENRHYYKKDQRRSPDR